MASTPTRAARSAAGTDESPPCALLVLPLMNPSHPHGGSMMNYAKEDTTASTVRALNDALNAGDREATGALFRSDGVFRPGAAGLCFEGPRAATDALFSFLELHKSGRF